MKTTILLLFAVLLFNCTPRYIQTIDVETGRFITVREPNNVTKVNDTLIIYQDQRNIYFYGKYIGKLPKSDDKHTFHKVVRIK